MEPGELRRKLLWLFVACLGVTALLAIAAVLGGDFSDFVLRVLGSSASVSAASICAMACAAFRERSRWPALGTAGIVLAAITLAFALVAIWRERLADLEGVWSVFQDTLEVARDPQAVANDYIVEVELGDLEGHVCPLVANPVQFGGRPGTTRPAPEYAQHSEEILLERGKTWDEIHALKACGALT